MTKRDFAEKRTVRNVQERWTLKKTLCSSCAFLLVFVCVQAGTGRPPEVSDLKCEYLRNPLGIDVPGPRLSWIVRSPLRGERQIAYRVQAASEKRLLAEGKPDLWDTGRVECGRTLNVVYAGRNLRSRQRCWWRVKVWGERGGESPWSGISFWEMGFLNGDDWTAKWIDDGKPVPARDEEFYRDDPAPLFRKTFRVEKKVVKARLYISGLGYYEAFLNGKRIGDCVLDPLWTTYSKRVLYRVYDVSSLVRRGKNAVGATLGNGWYNPLPMRMWGRFNLREALTVGRPRLLAQLEIEYRDGSRLTVATDESWKTTGGPVLRNSVYLGETYDARREIAGWSEAGFDDSGWRRAHLSGSGLGLMNVYRIVREHDGGVEIESERGRGTRVRVRLPLSQRPIRLLAEEPVVPSDGDDESTDG